MGFALTPGVQNKVLILCFLILSACTQAVAQTAVSQSSIRVEPHTYSARRGNEPLSQLVFFSQIGLSDLKGKYPYEINAHADFESWGRKDNSIDVDRAWVQYSHLIAGRIHPWDISNHPAATHSWGLLGVFEPQSQSVLLGRPFGRGVFPQPALKGWIGFHFWSDPKSQKNHRFGVSYSPLFIPGSGSEIDYNEANQGEVGRFARRVPGRVQYNGHSYPIRYQVNDSKIMDEVLQSQWMVHSYHKIEWSHTMLENWFSFSVAPTNEVEVAVDSKLDLTKSEPEVVAHVTPRFVPQWAASSSHRFTSKKFPFESAVLAAMSFRQNGVWGAEIGLDSTIGAVSFLTTQDMASSGKTALYSQPKYEEYLVQWEARLPLYSATLYGGSKFHLLQNGYWVRGGVRTKIQENFEMDLGVEAFSGNKESYFGEWRTNDRAFLGLTWRF